MRILVAEDEPAARTLLAALLSKAGHQVVLAEDGLVAWNILQTPDAPRLLLLDWMMPGIDGTEICQRLRARGGVNPPYVIMVTARSSPEDIARGLDAGADDYMTKPYVAVELMSRIRAGTRQLDLQGTLQKRVDELQEALLYVRQLEDLLAVCVYCRRVRDQGDVWRHFDEYVQVHSDSRVSHGCCPSCLETHHPKRD